VRKVMQVAGITNVLTKSLGTSKPAQRGQSHFRGVAQLERRGAQVAETRSKTVDEISGRQPKEQKSRGE